MGTRLCRIRNNESKVPRVHGGPIVHSDPSTYFETDYGGVRTAFNSHHLLGLLANISTTQVCIESQRRALIHILNPPPSLVQASVVYKRLNTGTIGRHVLYQAE